MDRKLRQLRSLYESAYHTLREEDDAKDLIDDFEYGTLDDALEELPMSNVDVQVDEDAADDIQKDLNVTPVDDPSQLKDRKDKAGIAGQTARLVHNSTVKGLVDEEGGEWNLEKLAKILTERPSNLLSQNGKMKKSGEGVNARLFFDLSLPAYHGLFVDEKTGQFKLVKTCPSAGACKAFCYAAKGGYIQYPASSVKTGRNLNYLLNDPDGFRDQMIREIKALHKRASKKGKKLSVRWHDSGDFFNEYYTDLAFAVAEETPEVDHYAYTKQVPMMKGKEKPANFIFNYSQGGLHDKMIDPEDKQSIVIPKKLFDGLDLSKPADVQTLKHNIAFKYDLDDSKIITYPELLKTPESDKPQWHVIVDNKSGDDAAVRKDVIGTLLLIH